MTDHGLHIPVLGREATDALMPVDGASYVDATLGGGGYTRMLLGAANCKVFAFDRDPVAIERAQAWSGAYAGRLTLLPHPFADMAEVLPAIEVPQVDGVVADLGVSSWHLDEASRGFSFQADGPLNMRMDGAKESDAESFVNEASEKDLADIIYIYGEEKKSRGIAKAIVASRAEKRITTTGDLVKVVISAVGERAHEKIHPATRVFQAIRIFVNDELGQLVRLLISAEHLLRPTGRLSVVTFHSLEDRIVKRFFAARAGQGGGSRHLPEVDGPKPTFSLLNRKAIGASSEEVAENPRARSAKLRVGIRTDQSAIRPDDNFMRQIGLPRLTLSPALSNWSPSL